MLLSLKVKTILAYVNRLLIDGENMRIEGKGVSIVDDEDQREDMLNIGNKLINFCSKNGATHGDLSNLSKFNMLMWNQARQYYQICIDTYAKHIKDSDVKGHIPILYACLIFKELEAIGSLKVDGDLQHLLDIIENSDILKGELRPSRFNKDKMIHDKSEINAYNICVKETIDKVLKHKYIEPRRKKRR